MKVKDIIYQIIGICVPICIILFVGSIVIDDISNDNYIAIGFCIDKEGSYNISEYNYTFNNYSEIVNCTNKENPVMIDTALMVIK